MCIRDSAPSVTIRRRLTAARHLPPPQSPYGRKRMPTGRHGSRGKQGQIPLQEQSMRSFPPARRLRQFRRPIPRLPSCRPPTPRMNLRPMRGRLRRHPRLPLQRIPRCRLLRRLPHRKHRNRLSQKLPLQHQMCQSRQQRQYRRLPRNSALLSQRRLWPPLAPRPVHPARAAHV